MIFIGRNNLRFHTLYMLITECLKLLIVLLKLVPNLQRIRVISKAEIVERVICFIKVLTLVLYTFRLHFLILVFFCKQPNDDILQIIKEQKTHLNQSPFICCVGTLQNPASFSVVCEGEVIEAGHNSIDAFKTLYASFHMFRIQYPSLLSTFFYFFDSFIFHVHPGKIRPSVADLHVQLRAGLGSA
jgi:hypothetical protein